MSNINNDNDSQVEAKKPLVNAGAMLFKQLTALADQVKLVTDTVGKFLPLVEGKQFSDSAGLCAYGNHLTVTVRTREDLAVALSLMSGPWKKSPYYNGLCYTNEVGRYYDADYTVVQVYSEDAALPPTCKVIEEEVEEAATPARMVKRRRVVCNSGAADASESEAAVEPATEAVE